MNHQYCHSSQRYLSISDHFKALGVTETVFKATDVTLMLPVHAHCIPLKLFLKVVLSFVSREHEQEMEA
jgi:hypothetical protein